MSNVRYGLGMAAKEHLLSGETLTRLDAIMLYGVSNLTMLISSMRKEGWVVNSRKIPYSAVAKRINKYAVFEPPKNLPIRDIFLTEYWVSK